jgi:two-component system chemotaxis response regulator CheY
MARLLIVDDASFMRGSLKYIAEMSGHEVVGEGKDGKEALRLYKELRPDLVTMDILMGKTDGLWALEAIMKEYPEAKVIMVTAWARRKNKRRPMISEHPDT